MATAKSRNTFAIWTTAAVVAVVAVVVVLVVWMNSAAVSAGTPPTASNVDSETGAISFGEGEDKLDTYVDFMCPACNAFEQKYSDSIQDLVEDGSITLNVHPIAILDRLSQGTEYSTRAANAMYCVADSSPDAALPFMEALYANQPAENSTGLTNDELIQIASTAGATGIDSCVTDQTYEKFVAAMTRDTPLQPGNSRVATPTVAVNGETIVNTDLPASPADLDTLFK